MDREQFRSLRRRGAPRFSLRWVRRSRALVAAYRDFLADWAENGLESVRDEAAGERARSSVATLIGVDPSDVAIRFDNHEDDIERISIALSDV